MTVTAVILAAGRSTRMRSKTPKVLHKIAGIMIIEHLVITAIDYADDIILVINKDMTLFESFQSLLTRYPEVRYVYQEEQLGTAHGASCALPHITTSRILVLCGDIPLISKKTMEKMSSVMDSTNAEIVNLAFHTNNPYGYGRMVTGYESELFDIIEEKDANDEQRKITLCNAGIILSNVDTFKNLIPMVNNNNLAKEYYMTDIIRIANSSGIRCCYFNVDSDEVLGINNRLQLAEVESIIQKRLKNDAMLNGVTMVNPDTISICADTIFGQDVIIHQHVVIGEGVVIGDNSEILSFSHITGTKIANDVTVGPFARTRPGTVIKQHCKIGNFVEVKNSTIANNSKASHLSYIGDANIGHDVNIGAGTIFCNYDGKKKHRTSIGNETFIGSNVALVAPVKIGDESLVAAGTVITKDVGDKELAIARTKQRQLKKTSK